MMSFRFVRRTGAAISITIALALVACGGESSEQGSEAVSPAASTTPGKAEPRPGGTVHVVDMVTDGDGNYFEPRDFEVRQGDVIRWRLRTGVHNAVFTPDSNPGVAKLPEPTTLLQLPGQTYDVLVETAPGTYYYQCDPHALLGMVGHVTVVAP